MNKMAVVIVNGTYIDVWGKNLVLGFVAWKPHHFGTLLTLVDFELVKNCNHHRNSCLPELSAKKGRYEEGNKNNKQHLPYISSISVLICGSNSGNMLMSRRT